MCFKGIAKHRSTVTATALQPDSPTSMGCHLCNRAVAAPSPAGAPQGAGTARGWLTADTATC